MDILLSITSFLTALGLAFFLPGFVWCRALFRRSFSVWEEIVYSFLGSLTLINLSMLILGRVDLPLNAMWTGGTLFLVTSIGAALAWKRHTPPSTETPTLSFSKRGRVLFFLLIALTLFIRTLYLHYNILPTATDLGHHVYWAKLISVTEKLPVYEKIEVISLPEENRSLIAAPKPIADFIIGEHLPLAFLASLTGLDFLSAFPVVFLHLINLLALLACVALAFRIGLVWKQYLAPETLALATLLFLGPLFTLASPHAKFVSGGVVGNLFGNLFIPAILLLFYRGLSEKRPSFLAGAIGLSFILAYTHHLSVLVLAFLLLGIAFCFMIASYKDFWPTLQTVTRLFLSAPVLITLFSIGLFMALIALPTYLEPAAIDSAIGTPTKTTRTGLSFLQVTNSIGMGKVALGCLGLIILLGVIRRERYAGALLLGWGSTLLIMALFPHWLFLDIPSSRIGSYLSYPLAILAALTIAFGLAQLKRVSSTVSPLLQAALLLGISTFVIGTGVFDNASSITTRERGTELVQTFAATEYLSEHTNGEAILKDHNYLAADAWMKLFFLRDYGYPLSRGLFSRYEEGGNRRERCTLAMISTPNTPTGEQCFQDTGVRYLVVNPRYDSAQFEKSQAFSKLYSSEHAAIFEKKTPPRTE